MPTETQSDAARAASALIMLAKATRALHAMRLREIGFQPGQDELILILDQQGKTVSAVADELDIRPSTVSKMADRLVEKGLVTRVSYPRDQRKTMLKITEKGLAICATLTQARDALGVETAAALPASISSDSLEEFAAGLLKRLRRLR